MPKWLFGKKIAILPFWHFCPCASISKFFWQNDFSLTDMKDLLHSFVKKCLRPCPGLSMHLSERINWNISSFPHRISKILFVLGSWDHFGSLGCRIGECPFSYVSILFLSSVSNIQLQDAVKEMKLLGWWRFEKLVSPGLWFELANSRSKVLRLDHSSTRT